jgi:predicted RNA-binding protein with RPS1 domain
MDRIEKIRENLKAIGNFLSPDLRQHITWVHESYIKDVNNLLSALEEKEKKIKRLKDSAAIDLDVARDLIRERDQAELTMAKLRAQLVDVMTDKWQAEARVERLERNIEDWKTTAEIEAEGLEGWKDTAMELQAQLATAREALGVLTKGRAIQVVTTQIK